MTDCENDLGFPDLLKFAEEKYEALLTAVAVGLCPNKPSAEGPSMWAKERSDVLRRLASHEKLHFEELARVAFFGKKATSLEGLTSDRVFGPVAAALGIRVKHKDAQKLLGSQRTDPNNARKNRWFLDREKFTSVLAEHHPTGTSAADGLWAAAREFEEALSNYASLLKQDQRTPKLHEISEPPMQSLAPSAGPIPAPESDRSTSGEEPGAGGRREDGAKTRRRLARIALPMVVLAAVGTLAWNVVSNRAKDLGSCKSRAVYWHGRSKDVVKLISFDKGSDSDNRAFDMVARHCSEQADINVERVACEHDDFKRNWREYLKHYPNSVFAWLGGEMVKRAMNDKLIEPFPQNRKVVKGLFPTARAHDLSHAVPFRFYPWAIYYNVNLLEEIPRPEDKSTNYAKNPPEDWADFLALANLLKAKGKRPIALGNLQGWPALGVFDILNLRINGYEFHENLLMGSGKSAAANHERWNDTRIRRVFKEWARLVPYFRTAQEDDESIRSVTRWTNRQSCASYYGTNSASGNDRLWWNTKTDKEAAEALMAGDAAMVLTGGFVAKYLQKADGKFGVFKFPATRPEASPFPRPDDTTAIDIAVDSFVLSKRKPTDGQCRECPDELLLCLQKTETFGVFNKQDSDMTPGGFLSVNDGSKEAVKYTALQMQEYEIVKNATHLANFLDRETTGTFAEDVVIPSLRCFLDYTSGFGNATDFDNDTDFDNFVTSVVSEIEDRAQKWKQNR